MNLYPYQTTANPNLPVYRPTAYDGLLGKSKTNELLSRFSGGLLKGFQVNPVQDPTNYGMRQQGGAAEPTYQAYGNNQPFSGAGQGLGMVTPMEPDGIYSVNDTGSASTGTAAPQGDYTMQDVFRLQRALDHGSANGTYGGNQTDVFNWLTQNDDGSFGLSQMAQDHFGGYAGTAVEGNPVAFADMSPERQMQRMISRFDSRPEYNGGSSEGL